MKLGLNACILIMFMLIMGLVAAASTNTVAASYCYWDAIAKKNVCVSEPSQLSQPTIGQSTGNGQSTITNPYTYGCHWDATAKKNVCSSDMTVPQVSFSSGYSNYSPYSSYNPYGSGYTYYAKIYTSLCGWQYNVWVNFDYNCANDYPA